MYKTYSNFSIYLFAIILFHIVSISAQNPKDQFLIYEKGKEITLLADQNDDLTIKKTIEIFARDIYNVTGILPEIKTEIGETKGNIIIIGSLNKNSLIKDLIQKNLITVDLLKDKWETYGYYFLNKPYNNINQALVITGSDKRGISYGLFGISELIGVSPWYWWADVKPLKKEKVAIKTENYISNEPTVKYRGIFLNDEDWGLQPWAAKTFEPETGDIGPKTYARIFELLLRLKANTIWPAMHNCTRAFYHYPGNPLVADTFGIIVGSSHTEPMLRNNDDEWNNQVMGEYNYKKNNETIYKYWEERAKESSGYENIYTLGMRGIGDSGIRGMSSMDEKVDFLGKIIKDQREIIVNNINNNLDEVPQAFIPYKEVLDIYDNGLELPDDVTIVWPDDNYGYIRRLNSKKEMNRKGGSGVYYHISYWGRPHDYLWLSSTNPALIREEMIKAYLNNTKQMWILNVGDIKPMEYNIQLFMDMAFDASQFLETESEKKHLKEWALQIFGTDTGNKIYKILNDYYSLAFERRPEFMGWSQTEPTRDVQVTEFNHYYYGDQALQRINRYNAIINDTRKLFLEINDADKDAFFELVYYPVVCSGLMNKKFLFNEKALLYEKQGRASASDYSIMAHTAYDSIILETEYFNNKLASGKWKNIMSMKPRNLPVFEPLPQFKLVVPDDTSWGLSAEGDQNIRPNKIMYGSNRITPFGSLLNKTSYIDIFQKGNKPVHWEAKCNADWIKLSATNGVLNGDFGNKEKRIYLNIDKTKLPKENKLTAQIEIKAEGISQHIYIQAYNISSKKGVFIESDKIISIYAENFNAQKNSDNNLAWEVSDGLGYTGKSVTLKKTIQEIISPDLNNVANNPHLEYNFSSNSKNKIKVKLYCIPVHALNNNYKLRIGVAIDEGEIKTGNYQTFGRSEEWKLNVLSNQAVLPFNFDRLTKGDHVLKIYGIDPGVIIDRIIIEFGEVPSYYGNMEESR